LRAKDPFSLSSPKSRSDYRGSIIPVLIFLHQWVWILAFARMTQRDWFYSLQLAVAFGLDPNAQSSLLWVLVSGTTRFTHLICRKYVDTSPRWGGRKIAFFSDFSGGGEQLRHYTLSRYVPAGEKHKDGGSAKCPSFPLTPTQKALLHKAFWPPHKGEAIRELKPTHLCECRMVRHEDDTDKGLVKADISPVIHTETQWRVPALSLTLCRLHRGICCRTFLRATARPLSNRPFGNGGGIRRRPPRLSI